MLRRNWVLAIAVIFGLPCVVPAATLIDVDFNGANPARARVPRLPAKPLSGRPATFGTAWTLTQVR